MRTLPPAGTLPTQVSRPRVRIPGLQMSRENNLLLGSLVDFDVKIVSTPLSQSGRLYEVSLRPGGDARHVHQVARMSEP